MADIYMRTLLGAIGAVVMAMPLLAQSQTPAGGPGALGPVDALGQAVRRPLAPTGPAPRLPDGTIDFGDGIWIGSTGQISQALPRGESLPLLPAAKALMADRTRRPTDDPHLWCLPMGVPRSTVYPFRFVQNYTHRKPTHLFILHEGNIHSYRQIFMDGRTHPAELDPTWFGHSIGWYDKNTLVIDTVGFNDKFWFDRDGTPHTEQLHTTERWTRPNRGALTSEVTIDDPGAYSRPFTVTFNAQLGPPTDDLMEYICQENNQFGVAGGHANPFGGAAQEKRR